MLDCVIAKKIIIKKKIKVLDCVVVKKNILKKKKILKVM